MALTRRKPLGATTFHVLDPEGTELDVKSAAAHALNRAQKLAEHAPSPVVLTVRRRTLLGPAVDLYRVTRTELGDVFTNSNKED